jgi:hypothetical protein
VDDETGGATRAEVEPFIIDADSVEVTDAPDPEFVIQQR